MAQLGLNYNWRAYCSRSVQVSQCVTTVAVQGGGFSFVALLWSDSTSERAGDSSLSHTPPYKVFMAGLPKWGRIRLVWFWNVKFLGLDTGMKLEVGKTWHLLHCTDCKLVSRSGCWVAPAAFFNLWASSQPSVYFSVVHHMCPVSWAPLGARRLCQSPSRWCEGALSTRRRRGNF